MQAGRQTGRQADRQAGRQAWQAGMAGRQAGRPHSLSMFPHIVYLAEATQHGGGIRAHRHPCAQNSFKGAPFALFKPMYGYQAGGQTAVGQAGRQTGSQAGPATGRQAGRVAPRGGRQARSTDPNV